MKKDLVTVIVTAVIGFVAAFFLTNILLPGLENFSFKTLGATINASVTSPSDEMFNYRSVNPTVEVFVGQCKEYNANGECVESFTGSDQNNNQDNNQDTENNTETPEGETQNGDTN